MTLISKTVPLKVPPDVLKEWINERESQSDRSMREKSTTVVEESPNDLDSIYAITNSLVDYDGLTTIDGYRDGYGKGDGGMKKYRGGYDRGDGSGSGDDRMLSQAGDGYGDGYIEGYGFGNGDGDGSGTVFEECWANFFGDDVED